MERAIVVRGKLCDPSQVELEEPVSDISGRVEVTIRAVQEDALGSPQALLSVLRSLPDIEADDVDELERAIERGKLPSKPVGLFDTDVA